MRTSNLTANVAMFTAAVLFGASVVAVRVAVQDVSPLALALLRFAQGAVILLLWLLVAARRQLTVARRDVPFIIFLGVLLYAIFPVAFNAGLRLTEASRGSLILATAPLATALLARAVNNERLSRRQIAGVLVASGGVALTLIEQIGKGQGSSNALLGDGLIVICVISGAVYTVYAKRMLGRYSALTIVAYGMLAGSLLLLPAVLIEGHPTTASGLTGTDILLILFLGIGGGALGWYLNTFALGRLMPTEAAVYINLNPMVATVLGVSLLAEKLTVEFVLGFAAVLVGVLLVNWPTQAAQPAPTFNTSEV